MKLIIPVGKYANLTLENEQEINELALDGNKLTARLNSTKLIMDAFTARFPVESGSKYERKPVVQPIVFGAFANRVFGCPLNECRQPLVAKIAKTSGNKYWKDMNADCEYFVMDKDITEPPKAEQKTDQALMDDIAKAYTEQDPNHA